MNVRTEFEIQVHTYGLEMSHTAVGYSIVGPRMKKIALLLTLWSLRRVVTFGCALQRSSTEQCKRVSPDCWNSQDFRALLQELCSWLPVQQWKRLSA